MEVAQVDRLIEQMNAEPLAFVVHVGDIGSSARACSDDWLLARKEQFSHIRHPLVLVPGDNEWTDCREQSQRLKAWRKLFCFPANGLDLSFQKGEFCEHVRWEAGGTLFVALNVPGSNNNVRRPDEYAPRMEAVFAWIDQSAALARQRGLRLALLMQADPFVTAPRDGYGTLREKLRELGARQSTVLIHGDTHLYRDDEPLPGVRRIEVWGSPVVDWLRVAF
ncbi:MAG TPA: hypothetical protein VGI18_07285 [Burkholderiales bacterium]|jgi:hypothetical protein